MTTWSWHLLACYTACPDFLGPFPPRERGSRCRCGRVRVGRHGGWWCFQPVARISLCWLGLTQELLRVSCRVRSMAAWLRRASFTGHARCGPCHPYKAYTYSRPASASPQAPFQRFLSDDHHPGRVEYHLRWTGHPGSDHTLPPFCPAIPARPGSDGGWPSSPRGRGALEVRGTADAPLSSRPRSPSSPSHGRSSAKQAPTFSGRCRLEVMCRSGASEDPACLAAPWPVPRLSSPWPAREIRLGLLGFLLGASGVAPTNELKLTCSSSDTTRAYRPIRRRRGDSCQRARRRRFLRLGYRWCRCCGRMDERERRGVGAVLHSM